MAPRDRSRFLSALDETIQKLVGRGGESTLPPFADSAKEVSPSNGDGGVMSTIDDLMTPPSA